MLLWGWRWRAAVLALPAMSRFQPKYATTCVERFLRYVTYDTQSEEGVDAYPSTPKQLDLQRLLEAELRQLGLQDVRLDQHGYLTATVPATVESAPVIGFVSHVDTSPEMSGAGVVPIVHADYQGQDLVLPDAADAVLKRADNPDLEAVVGHDVITASGSTLLGADDKAGVAVMVAAAEYWMAHPELPRGEIRLAFTPDEEIGRGTEFFDVPAFGARYAYTVDGGAAGELEVETFSADSVRITFHGFNTHPGYAKGRMVNALRVFADFLGRLPKDSLSPETTDGYQGYIHPNVVEGGVERVTVRILLRDFDSAQLAVQRQLLERLAAEAVAAWPGARFDIETKETYRNMREVLDQHPVVVEVARRAMEEAGLEVVSPPVRGGTDGSRLSFMGLPTPNIFCGSHNIHSRLEWTSDYELHKAVEVVLEIGRLWSEEAATRRID